MKKCLLIILCSFTFTSVFAQYNKWERTTFSLSITKQTCKDNSNNYYIYNSDGFIYKTTEQFKKFTKLEYKFETSVVTLHYVSSGIFLAGTLTKGIYRSSNASYWERVTNGLPDSINISGFTSNGNIVFAATSKGVFYSSNAGLSWSPRSNGLASNYNASNIAMEQGGKIFVTEDRSYSLGNRGVFKSTDNGLSWNSVPEIPQNDRYFFIYVSDENKIFISSRGVLVGTLYEDLFQSTDSGNSFQRIGNVAPSSLIHLNGDKYLSIFHPESGYQSVLAKSFDNGANWFPVSQLFHGSYENLIKLSDGAVMVNSPIRGNLKTTDASSWTREVYGVPLAKVDKVFCGTNSPYILGALVNQELYTSTNSGDEWNIYSRQVFDPNNEPILDFTIKDNLIYALTPGMIFKSTDFGLTYNYTHSFAFPVTGICVKNTANIFLYGNTINKTTNEGINWTSQSSGIPPTDVINKMTTDDVTGFIYAVTNSSGIYRSINNGDSWEAINNGIPLTGIISISASYSLIGAGTESSGFYYSSNSGSSWSKANYGIATDSLSYSAVSLNSGFCVVGTRSNSPGENGKGIFFNLHFNNTFNYGLTDLNINSVTGPLIYYLFAGGDTCVYRTDLRDDIRNISSEIPNKFSLSQNYPNPFNPSTKFIYELNQKTLAKISVFDITGREIATLLDGVQNAGVYEATFDAGKYGLTSGIYFYTLKTDGFIETKKMVLVK